MSYTVILTAATQSMTFVSTATGGNYKFTVTEAAGGAGYADIDFSATPSWTYTGLGTNNFTFTAARVDLASAVLGSTITATFLTATTVVATDITPPTITWQVPTQGATVSGTFAVHYTVSDATDVPSRTLFIDGVAQTSSIYISTATNNGEKVFVLNATDSIGNATSSTIRVFVFNPVVVATPVASVDHKIIILSREQGGRVKYILWATVPASIQADYAGKIAVSRWPSATSGDNAALLAGERAEDDGQLNITTLTNDQMKLALEARWNKFQADIQAQSIWPFEDAYWDGASWFQQATS